jgi:hypothetical protein
VPDEKQREKEESVLASLKVSLDFNIDAISCGNSSSVNAGRLPTVSIRVLIKIIE